MTTTTTTKTTLDRLTAEQLARLLWAAEHELDRATTPQRLNYAQARAQALAEAVAAVAAVNKAPATWRLEARHFLNIHGPAAEVTTELATSILGG